MPDPLTFMWNIRKGCKVHPNAAEEQKTTGLLPKSDESREQAYARWARSKGWECSCPEPLKSALVQFETVQ